MSRPGVVPLDRSNAHGGRQLIVVPDERGARNPRYTRGPVGGRTTANRVARRQPCGRRPHNTGVRYPTVHPTVYDREPGVTVIRTSSGRGTLSTGVLAAIAAIAVFLALAILLPLRLMSR